MDQSKRKSLIERYLNLVAGGGSPTLLTDEDRRVIERARVLDPDPTPPVLDAEGMLVIDHDPLLKLYADLGRNSDDLFAIVMNDTIYDDGKLSATRPALAIERVIRILRQQERNARSVITVAAAEFFDGNDDIHSIAPNREPCDHASFNLIRTTILETLTRDTVACVGIELDDCPAPDSEADAEEWPTAGRVFVWTTEKLSVVKKWWKPLNIDGMGKVALRAVRPPAGVSIAKKTVVYGAGWD